ncbi:MAG: RNA 2',3'-cyclic phosphodiesterase [Acidobacteriia bacterium]|nr:RNA 2',3'-cyclic phosphodiesterase [Terriglobia bacterium]
MRVFIGLDIPEEIRARMTRYLEGVRGFAPDARWVKPESFHVTLKFIGEQKPEQVEQIKRELATVHAIPFDISFRGNGFFPTARSPRVFWLGIEAGEQLPQLAKAVDEAVSRTGVPRETNDYRPHLTLARTGSGRPHPMPGDQVSPPLRRLGDKLQGKPAPDFGTMTAREFFLYESKLGPGGARYTKIARFPL